MDRKVQIWVEVLSYENGPWTVGDKTFITAGLGPRISEALRISMHYLRADIQEHHAIDHLGERSLIGWDRVDVTQINIETVSSLGCSGVDWRLLASVPQAPVGDMSAECHGRHTMTWSWRGNEFTKSVLEGGFLQMPGIYFLCFCSVWNQSFTVFFLIWVCVNSGH